MFAKARAFFSERGVLEVDCPIMSSVASVDTHIDLIKAYGASSKVHYLHSSPEYGMKKLLAEGIGDIYQLSHVFRDNESSLRHHPEFTMVEWYRIGISYSAMMQETVTFIREFLGNLPSSELTYREAFIEYAGIDYLKEDEDTLLRFLQEREIPLYEKIEEEGKDGLLNLIFATLVQSELGHGSICVLKDFPPSQAMLSKILHRDEESVAERFEIFYQGLELANGYHELSNAKEQMERLVVANQDRATLGKETYPIDVEFIQALEKGLPDCCGVSVGFDRLMMLRHKEEDIANVLPLAERDCMFT